MTQLTLTEQEQEKWDTRPPYPGGRPPTRAEAWEYCDHWYGDLKDEAELVQFAKEMFVANYVYYVNFLGWTNPPDWKEGEEVVPEACPKRPFPAVSPLANAPEVYRLMKLQKGGS